MLSLMIRNCSRRAAHIFHVTFSDLANGCFVGRVNRGKCFATGGIDPLVVDKTLRVLNLPGSRLFADRGQRHFLRVSESCGWNNV